MSYHICSKLVRVEVMRWGQDLKGMRRADTGCLMHIAHSMNKSSHCVSLAWPAVECLVPMPENILYDININILNILI